MAEADATVTGDRERATIVATDHHGMRQIFRTIDDTLRNREAVRIGCDDHRVAFFDTGHEGVEDRPRAREASRQRHLAIGALVRTLLRLWPAVFED